MGHCPNTYVLETIWPSPQRSPMSCQYCKKMLDRMERGFICLLHIEAKIMCHSNRGCKEIDSDQNTCGCSERRVPRQLQPFILLILKGKDSYGYELIEKISDFRFHDSPPGCRGDLQKSEEHGERGVSEVEMGYKRRWSSKADLSHHPSGRRNSARVGSYCPQEERCSRPVSKALPETL
jgi:hypothetical protein